MTTAPHGDLRRRDFHPLVKQLASLRSLHGVPRGGSPASKVLRDAPTPLHPSRRTSLPSLGGIPAAPAVRSRGRRVQPAAGLELVTRGSRRDLPRRWRGLPGSWRTPVLVPCSPTPAGSHAPGHCGAATRPSVTLRTSAPAMMTISGLNHTARSLAVYASQPGLPRHHARLASGYWPSSAGRGWLPAGSQRKVSACGFPLSQAFPGALKLRPTRFANALAYLDLDPSSASLG